MRLLILNYEYPPLGGGAGIISQNIAEGLAKRNHDITVLTTWYLGTETICVENNVRVIRLKSKRKNIFCSNPLEMLSWIITAKRFLKKHLEKEKYDLCFANFALPCGEVAYSMKLLYKLPYVVISHGHDIPWFFPEQMMWYHAATYQWIRKICMQAERNYVQSDEMKKNIDAFLGGTTSKNELIYNGWNRNLFRPDFTKQNEKFTILFVGRLVLQKDPMTLLNSIKIIKDKIPNFEVIIVGEGDLHSKMEKYVSKNNLSKIVKFKGWLNKQEILTEYKSASLFIMPSLAEGMSIAILEAMACHLYIITTKVSNNEKLIKEGCNGDFIEKKDSCTLAEKIISFYENKFKNKYIVPSEFIENFANEIDWENIIDKYENDLKNIIIQCRMSEKVQR